MLNVLINMHGLAMVWTMPGRDMSHLSRRREQDQTGTVLGMEGGRGGGCWQGGVCGAGEVRCLLTVEKMLLCSVGVSRLARARACLSELAILPFQPRQRCRPISTKICWNAPPAGLERRYVQI